MIEIKSGFACNINLWYWHTSPWDRFVLYKMNTHVKINDLSPICLLLQVHIQIIYYRVAYFDLCTWILIVFHGIAGFW